MATLLKRLVDQHLEIQLKMEVSQINIMKCVKNPVCSNTKFKQLI